MRKSQSHIALISLISRLSYVLSDSDPFKLASGKESNYFIDVKKAALTAVGHSLIGQVAHELLFDVEWANVDAVAGVALGGCSLASSLVMNEIHSSFPFNKHLDAIYVRKENKDHGTKSLIEGRIRKNMSVFLFEDVLTTGNSTLSAIRTLNAANIRTTGVIAVVDRLEGAVAKINDIGLPVITMMTIKEIKSQILPPKGG